MKIRFIPKEPMYRPLFKGAPKPNKMQKPIYDPLPSTFVMLNGPKNYKFMKLA